MSQNKQTIIGSENLRDKKTCVGWNFLLSKNRSSSMRTRLLGPQE